MSLALGWLLYLGTYGVIASYPEDALDQCERAARVLTASTKRLALCIPGNPVPPTRIDP